MKKTLLFSLAAVFYSQFVTGQTTGTYVVADKGTRMASCQDTLITLEDIYIHRGIRDLNDPSDNVSNYRILRLDGSLITTDEITEPFKYSDYPAVFIHKKNNPLEGHTGIQIFLNNIVPPAKLFTKDSLKYTVERGAKINYSPDFFGNMEYWGEGFDIEVFNDRVFFTDHVEPLKPLSQVPDWQVVGKGQYMIQMNVAVCDASDIHTDSVHIVVNESPCHSLEIRNMPAVCRDEVVDITPYVYLDGHLATAEELEDMTFLDKSDILQQTAIIPVDPSAVNIASMFDNETSYPILELQYEPNTALGICKKVNYIFSTKVPSRFYGSNTVIGNNYGRTFNYVFVEDYYAFNNVFHKNVLKELYLTHYTNFAGTEFSFFTDSDHLNPVAGNDLAPGDYYVVASNPDCSNDSSFFNIHVKNQDFKITWAGATNLGTGYYTFEAEEYPGATYEWIAWGGQIVAGKGTKQITIYYSETASQGVAVSCEIKLPAARVAGALSSYKSAVYLTSNENGEKEEIQAEVITSHYAQQDAHLSSVYPNPSEGEIVITGKGTFDLKVYNTLGMLIYEDKAYSPNTPVNINEKGLHIIHLDQNGKKQVLKAVVK